MRPLLRDAAIPHDDDVVAVHQVLREREAAWPLRPVTFKSAA